MSIDKMGSRFYMQQGIAGSRNNKLKKPARLKKDIVAEIESTTGLVLHSLMNVNKETLEKLSEAFRV